MTVSFEEGVRVLQGCNYSLILPEGGISEAIEIIESLKSVGKVDYYVIGQALGLGVTKDSATRCLRAFRNRKTSETESFRIVGILRELIESALVFDDVSASGESEVAEDISVAGLFEIVQNLRRDLSFTLGSLRTSLEDIRVRVRRVEEHLIGPGGDDFEYGAC